MNVTTTAATIAAANAAIDAGTATNAQHTLLSDLTSAEITCAEELTEQGDGALTITDIRAALVDVAVAHLIAGVNGLAVRYEHTGFTDATVGIRLPGSNVDDVQVRLTSDHFGTQCDPPLAEIGWYSASQQSVTDAEVMIQALRLAVSLAGSPAATWHRCLNAHTAGRKAARATQE